MRTLRVVLGDHLTRDLRSLADIDAHSDVVLMMEVNAEATYVRHHKQKLVLVLSAMRHFAQELAGEGYAVDYVRLDATGNTGSFGGELGRACARHRPDRIVVCEPGEWRVRQAMERWRGPAGQRIEILDDDRFFADRARFARWAHRRTTYRMEYFYRELRRETGLLMEGAQPAGGRWNFDAENRRAWPARQQAPERLRFPVDAITREVIELVERRFGDHFGAVEAFGWPVTRADALRALDHFIATGLPRFGDYQDAMKHGEPWLCHSLLAPALNLGLLRPREVCRRAETAYRAGRAPLNAVEGFVRQILGWREYVRGIYWHLMPQYAASNALDAQRALPGFYWSGRTHMRCVSEVVEQTRKHAYAHHIQRLMITGNFALLAGVRPEEIEAWYLAVYADAFDWVELPNTHGMAMYADGGMLASKPYAASGAYITRMSDYCKGCHYDVKQRVGPRACPFNFLYWAFLLRNAPRLAGNPRMAMPYRTLAAWDEATKRAVTEHAEQFLAECER
jgi:deoxyribodipyrimidine photolyase-related protein